MCVTNHRRQDRRGVLTHDLPRRPAYWATECSIRHPNQLARVIGPSDGRSTVTLSRCLSSHPPFLLPPASLALSAPDPDYTADLWHTHRYNTPHHGHGEQQVVLCFVLSASRN